MSKSNKTKTKTIETKETFKIPSGWLWAIWAVYSVIVLYVTSNHEPWRDEAQSWLIARDNTLLSLFQYIPNEGHPPLWYLILMPFAKLGFPYSTANIIHNLIAIAFAWIMLFRIQLKIWITLPLLFSYFFVYEYAVIARNYSIVALLIAIAGSLYERRFEKPLLYAVVIFLLFQTNVLAFCTGVALGAIFFWEMIEQKRFNATNIIALGIMAAGGLAMIALLLSAGMESSYSKESSDKWYTLKETFGNAMFLTKERGRSGMAAYLLILLSFYRKPKTLTFLLIATAGYLYLALYQFQGTMRHHGFLIIFLIGAFMLSKFEKPLQLINELKWFENVGSLAFAFILLLQALKAVPVISDENMRNFSDARNAAEFITHNGLQHHTIVGHRSYAASAVAPYLPKPIWYADQQRYGTFVYLDTVFFNNYLKYSGDYAPYIVNEKFQNKDSVLLLMNMPIQYPEFLRQWQLIYQTREEPIKRDEIFFIYRHISN